MIFDETSVIEFIKDKSQKRADWVTKARNYQKTLRALVLGEEFTKHLIFKIEKMESVDRAAARKKYSKDIRDLFSRVMSKRQNVFDANGGSETINITNKKLLEKFNERMSNFKANKSLFDYLSENYFTLADVDPNGVMMLEYTQTGEDDFNVYPTYKSISDIYDYESDGQKLEYLIFEPIEREDVKLKIWRIVDELNDWTISELSGGFTVVEGKSFEHPFGEVPGLILSEHEKTGTEERLSSLDDILELAKDYAFDKSILNIYKKQKGFPVHWRFGSPCKSCQGLGKKGDKTCPTCDGKGYPRRADVTDMNIIPIPKDGQPNLSGKMMGFESPDLDTWKQLKEDLRDMEDQIENTKWGTDKTREEDKNGSETATGRFIDVQPIANALTPYTNNIQYVHNTFANWLVNFDDPTKTDKKEILYTRTYGHRYIIESPDVLIEKYQKSKKSGDNNTILDKILEEIILSTYKSDPNMQEVMTKKAVIEPYVHLSQSEVNSMYGAAEAYKKVLFQEFWKDVDASKDVKVLREELKSYLLTNKFKIDESSKKSEA